MKKLTCILASCFYSLFVLFGAVPVHAAADTCTWDGSTDGTWSDGSNWTGCDNGGVPETGDNLSFPVGAATTALNNDLAIIPSHITFDSLTTYSVNSIELSGDLSTFGTITYNGTVSFSASAGFQSLNAQIGTPTFNSNIDMNHTGTAAMTFFTTNSSLDLPVITGVANEIYFQGNPTAPIEEFNLASTSTFTADNIYIWRSIVNCEATDCLGADTNPIEIGGADTGGGAGLALDSAGLDLPNPVTITNTGVLEGPSFIGVEQTATLSGDVSIESDSNINIATSGFLTMSGTLDITGDDLFVEGDGDYTSSIMLINGVVSGPGNISFTGLGASMTNNNTTFDGDVMIEADALVTLNEVSVGTSVGGIYVADGGEFRTANSGDQTIADDISIIGVGLAGGAYSSAAYTNEGDQVEFTGELILTGSTTLDNSSVADSVIYQNMISGTGDLTLKSNNTSAYFDFSNSSANTFTGKTIVDGTTVALNGAGVSIPGDLDINSNSAQPAAANVNDVDQISDTSTVTLNTDTNTATLLINTPTETIGSITGDGVIDTMAGNELVVGNGDTTFNFGGMIDGDGTITKIGTGEMTFDNVTYQTPGTSPAVSVEDGNVQFNSTLGDTPVIASGDGTINGSGELGATSVDVGGTLGVGNSPGCMTLASLTMEPSSIFEQEIDGNTVCTQYDQTTLTGNADLGGATLDIILNAELDMGAVFTIIEAGSVSGTFNGLDDGEYFEVNGVSFRIDYNSDSVTLTVADPPYLAETGSSNIPVITFVTITLMLGAAILPYKTKIQTKK